MNELSTLRSYCSELEAKQRKFDQQLAEEKSLICKAYLERDQISLEVKIFNLMD